MSFMFQDGELLEEGSLVLFDNGVIKGKGRIRGFTSNPMPVIGVTYIVETETSTLSKETYPYSCIGLFACHITAVLEVPWLNFDDNIKGVL